MLWSPDSVIPDCTPAIVGLHHDSAIKVFLKLKPATDGVAKLAYKVKDSQTIVLEEGRQAGPITGQNLRLFVLDGIEDASTKTNEMASNIVNDSVSELLKGYNVAIMAYGQDQSGKTYTMFGDDSNHGVVQATCKQIFSEIDRKDAGSRDFTINVNILEVYCEEIRDLLALSDHRKGLKLRFDPSKSTLSIKGLRNVFVSSLVEVLSCLKQAKSNLSSSGKRPSSRTSVIVKISIEQRNNDDETVKLSTLQLIDLASSDKVDKNLDPSLTAEEAKRINNTMDTIENVARSLAGSKTTVKNKMPPSDIHHAFYKGSSLAQLLREVIGGNYKTTVILTCSTVKEDEEETLNTLNFGANMKLVNNFVRQNKSGFNAKRILDLMVQDFNLEQANYLSRIQLLQNEVSVMREKERGKEPWKSDSLVLENKKLKAQLDTLSQLLTNHGNRAQDEEHSKVMETLMEKCENVIQLQMKLDSERSHAAYLTSELEFKISREQALEAMNLKLLNQLQENEDELKEVLASNFSLKQDLHKWQNLATTSQQKNDSLEILLGANQTARTDERNRRSSASSAGSFMTQIDESSPLKKNSWFFGHSNINTRATRQISLNSVGSSGSLEGPRTREFKNGINLNAVSGDADSSGGK